MPVVTGSAGLALHEPKIPGIQPERKEAFSVLRRHLSAWFLSSLESGKEQLTLYPSAPKAFQNWPQFVQNRARELYGNKLAEILSLFNESDEEIFISSWSNFASREEAAGREGRAAALFAILAEHPSASSARKQLAVLQGEGEFGLQAEKLVRNFHAQAFDPAALGGMMAASTVFSGLKLVGLSRLLRAEAGFLTRGRGAQFLASALGMAGEVPAFLLTSKSISHGMGRPQDWRFAALAHEGATLGLGLLYLKGFGAIGQKAAAWQGGPMARRMVPDAAGLAGLYFGRRSEAALGLRPASDSANVLTESLAFLFQLKVGGELSHRLMGRAWREKVQETQWRSANAMPPTPPASLALRRPAEAAAIPSWFPPPEKANSKGPESVFMVGDQPHFSPTFSTDVMKVGFGERFPPPPEASVELKQNYPEILERLVENVQKTKGLDSVTFYEKLKNSRIKDELNDRHEITSRIQILDYATTYWRNVQEMDPLRRASGCLYDHLMQEALERTYHEGERAEWDALIKVAGWDRRIRHLEVFFQERNWDARYAFQDQPSQAPLNRLWRDAAAWYRRKIQKLEPLRQSYAVEVQKLDLSPEGRQAVLRYLDTFLHGKEAKAFLDSEKNYILLKPVDGVEKRERLTPELALAALEKFLGNSAPGSRRRQVLEDAIQKAAHSGTPLLQFDRLLKILATGNLSPKLVEIASGEPFHWGKLLGILKLSNGEPDYHSAGEHINGSIYTGYVHDPILAEKFARFYDKVSRVQNPDEAKIRRRQFHEHAYRILRRSPQKEFGTEEVLELLNIRNTLISRQAREAILAGEVELHVVSRAEAQDIYDSLRDNDSQGKPVPLAFYAPRDKTAEGVPLIVVQRQSRSFPVEKKVYDAVSLAAMVVHEFQHHLDSLHRKYLGPMELLRSEMRSWLEEIAFMVENGVLDEWTRVEPQTPYGFGVHLRNLIDKDYIEGPRDLVVSTEK